MKNRYPDPGILEKIKRDMLDAKVPDNEFPGKYFELAISHMLMTYVNNIDPEKLPDGKNMPAMGTDRRRDLLYGTDLILDDPTRTISSRRLTRIDLTTGFTGKNNMPLITPTDKMKLTKKGYNLGIVDLAGGDYMRFGIRIGNGRYGFDHPVVVAGICSPKELTMDRLEENILWMYGNALKAAPEIINTANKVMNRFRYMTDETYKAKLDAAFKPGEIDARYPVLVPNIAYLETEWKYRYSNPEKRRHPKTCRANETDAMYGIARHPYTDEPLMTYTDVPWMSEMGHAAVKAMLDGPRNIPDDYRRETVDMILAEPVRDPSQGPAIIVDANGKPLEKDMRSQKLSELTKLLSKPHDIDASRYKDPDWPSP